MGAGYMQSISVPHSRFPVFSELQGPMQDGYGIRQGWIQHSRVCILQTLCSCEFSRKGELLLAPSRNNAARVGTPLPALTPAKRLNIQLSKNELQAVYPWGL